MSLEKRCPFICPLNILLITRYPASGEFRVRPPSQPQVNKPGFVLLEHQVCPGGGVRWVGLRETSIRIWEYGEHQVAQGLQLNGPAKSKKQSCKSKKQTWGFEGLGRLAHGEM